MYLIDTNVLSELRRRDRTDRRVAAWADLPHEFVRHSAKQHVDGVVHTQTIDGFWSLLKRGIVGSFHKVSRKYLPLCVAEFEFRYNNRNMKILSAPR
jgi:hypothetical protein